MTLTSVQECDYLDQDPELRGQKFCCMSFISPEDVIKKKEVHFFNTFIRAFGADLSTMFDQIVEKIPEEKDTIEALKTRYDYLFDENALGEEYRLYLEVKGSELEADYLKANNFQTTLRGIKVRGSYDTLPEAQARAKLLQKNDPNFHVYVGQVGSWCPWAPNPEEIEDSEYAETQLNTMMKQYKENREKKDEHYQFRKDEMIKQVKMNAPDIQEEVDPWLKKMELESAPLPTDADADAAGASSSSMFLIMQGVFEEKIKAVEQNKKFEVKFIPRTYYEEQTLQQDVMGKVSPMFDKTAPWFDRAVGEAILDPRTEDPYKQA